VTNNNQKVTSCAIEDLPDGWSLETIPDLVGDNGVFSDGDWVESKDQDPDGNVRLIQLADIGDGFYRDRSNRFLTKEKAIELNCTFLETGDVLIARMPDPLGRACLFPGDKKESVTVVDVCVVRTGSTNVNHKWVMHFVNTPQVRRTIESLQSGTTRKRISRKNLAKIELPVPPLPEQERIVAKIEELFTQLEAGVAELQQAKAQLQRFRQAVLKSAVEGELTREWREAHQSKLEPAEKLLERILSERRTKWEAEQWEKEIVRAQKKATQAKRKAAGRPSRISDLEPEEWEDLPEDDYGRYLPKNDKWKAKYKEPESPNANGLPDLPEGWLWTHVEPLLDISRDGMKTGPFGSLLKKHEHQEEGVPVIGIENIGVMEYVPGSKIHITEEKAKQLAKYDVLEGDLVISRSGTVGEVAVIPEGLGEARLSTNVMRITLIPLSMRPKFFAFLFNGSPFVLGQVSDLCKGSSRDFLNQHILKSIIFPLPPVDEQDVIIQKVERRLSVADEIEKELDQALARSERLRQSILKSAFEGRLV